MFCSHCGKELAENQVCACTQSQTAAGTENTSVITSTNAPQSQPVYTEAAPQAEATFQPGEASQTQPGAQASDGPQENSARPAFDKDAALNNVNEKFQKTAAAFSQEAKGLLNLIPPILKTPAEGIRNYVESARTITGLQLIGVKAFATSLLMLCLLLWIDNAFGGWYTIPKAKPFFMTLVFVALLDYAFSWILYVFTTAVFKGSTTSEKMTALTGLRCLPETAAIILGAVGVIIWPPIGIAIYVTLFVLGLTYLVEGYRHAAAIDNSKWVYAISATYGVFFLVSMLAMYIMSNDLSSLSYLL